MSRVGITVEGGLLAADIVERIGLGDAGVPGQQAKDFGLGAARLSAGIQSAFSDLRLFWDGFKRRRAYSQDSPVTLTRRDWVIPALERLGYALRFERPGVQTGGRTYALSHRIGAAENATPVPIAAFNQKLDERGEARHSPHALVQEYLNNSDALWGIATNRCELRLCGAGDPRLGLPRSSRQRRAARQARHWGPVRNAALPRAVLNLPRSSFSCP
jgi:hypothetical protein